MVVVNEVQPQERAEKAIAEVLQVIEDAVATASAIYPREGVIRGPGMYFDFCAIAMRKARGNALIAPNAFAGNLVQLRHCLKEAVSYTRGRYSFNQDIVNAANAIGEAVDSALVEIRLARKEARQVTG